VKAAIAFAVFYSNYMVAPLISAFTASVDLTVIKRQPHMKRCPIGLRIESDGSEMLLDNSLHSIKSEAQARPEWFCRKERFEDTICMLRGNALAGIGDLNQNCPSLQSRGKDKSPRASHGVKRIFYARRRNVNSKTFASSPSMYDSG